MNSISPLHNLEKLWKTYEEDPDPDPESQKLQEILFEIPKEQIIPKPLIQKPIIDRQKKTCCHSICLYICVQIIAIGFSVAVLFTVVVIVWSLYS